MCGINYARLLIRKTGGVQTRPILCSASVEIGLDYDVNTPVSSSPCFCLGICDRIGLSISGCDHAIAGNAHRVDHIVLHGVRTTLRQSLIAFVAAKRVGVPLDNDFALRKYVDGFFDLVQQCYTVWLDICLATIERKANQSRQGRLYRLSRKSGSVATPERI